MPIGTEQAGREPGGSMKQIHGAKQRGQSVTTEKVRLRRQGRREVGSKSALLLPAPKGASLKMLQGGTQGTREGRRQKRRRREATRAGLVKEDRSTQVRLGEWDSRPLERDQCAAVSKSHGGCGYH